MSNDLLPEKVNIFLDDVETSLCLPILIVIVLCTAQFVLNHAIDIGYTVYQNIQKSSDDDEAETSNNKSSNMMEKIKGFVCNLAFASNPTDNKANKNITSPALEANSREEEWDYCEEDDD